MSDVSIFVIVRRLPMPNDPNTPAADKDRPSPNLSSADKDGNAEWDDVSEASWESFPPVILLRGSAGCMTAHRRMTNRAVRTRRTARINDDFVQHSPRPAELHWAFGCRTHLVFANAQQRVGR